MSSRKAETDKREMGLVVHKPKVMRKISNGTARTKEERRNKVMELWSQGMKKAEIARHLSIHRNTVDKYLKDTRRQAQEAGIMQRSAVEVLTGLMQKLEHQESEILSKIALCRDVTKVEKRTDATTGQVQSVEVHVPDPNAARYQQILLNVRKQASDLLLATGALPRDREQLLAIGQVIAGKKKEPETEEEIREALDRLNEQKDSLYKKLEESGGARTDDEIRQDIMNLLKSGRRLRQ